MKYADAGGSLSDVRAVGVGLADGTVAPVRAAWAWVDDEWVEVYSSAYYYFDAFDRLTDTLMEGTAYENDWWLVDAGDRKPYVDAGGYFRSSAGATNGTTGSPTIIHKRPAVTKHYRVTATSQGTVQSYVSGLVIAANPELTHYLLAQFTSTTAARGLWRVTPAGSVRVATFATSTVSDGTKLSASCQIDSNGIATYEVRNVTQNQQLCSWTDTAQDVPTTRNNRHCGLVVTNNRSVLGYQSYSNSWRDFELADVA